MKILSWNIWVDCDFEEVKTFLRAADADILGLQEVRDDDLERDVIGFLKALGYEHVFARTEKYIEHKTYSQGPAIFSRFPIRASETHFLDTDTPAIQADIEVNGKMVHVLSTQLSHTHGVVSAQQEQQVKRLLEVIPKGGSVTVMGDFNMTPDSGPIQVLKSILRDTGKDTDVTWSVHPGVCGVCSPQALDVKIDYIFTSKDLPVGALVVGESKASDHLPLMVNIEV